MSEDKAPTLQEVKQKKTAYESFYSQLRTQQKEIDNYYELTFDAGVPKKYNKRMPSTARDWVDVGVRHFTLDNPKSVVYPRRISDAGRKQAGLLSAFYDFWLRKDTPTIKIGSKKVLIRGEGFFKLNLDDLYFGNYKGKPVSKLSGEEIKEYREKRLFHFPLYMSSPDPINMLPSPAHDGYVPADVIESFDITVAEAQLICKRNGWDWSTTRKATTTVNWLSYIDENWRFFAIDNEPVLEGDAMVNIFGFVPYVHFGAGLGQTSWEGKPEYLYRPLLYPKKDMLKMEARMLSWIDAMNSRYAWQRYILKGNPELIKQYYPEGLPTDPDQLLIAIPNQMEIDILAGKDPPAGLFQEYALLQSAAAPPAVLTGMRMAGVYSGQHQEDLMSSAKPIYKDAFKNVEGALGVLLGMGARVAEKVYQLPVAFKNLSSEENKLYSEIKPTDIGGHYDCEVQLLAESPEATDVRKALGKTLWQGGAISLRTMLIQYFNMSEGEADNEMAQIIAEKALLEPNVRNIVAMDAMEQLGMEKAQEQLQTATELANQQASQLEGGGVRSIPPIQQGQGITTGRELLTQRGRGRQGMNTVPTTREQQLGAAAGAEV